jgi:hypothetical protein
MFESVTTVFRTVAARVTELQKSQDCYPSTMYLTRAIVVFAAAETFVHFCHL